MPSDRRTPQDSINDTSETMTIGGLSDVTGLSASAIRFYERRGLLPARTAGSGWQRYDRRALERLAVIELAKRAGFNLDEAIRLLDALDVDPDSVPGATPIWIGLAQAKAQEIDEQIERLRHMRRLLDEALTYAYLPPDLAREVPAMLGWTAQLPACATLPDSVVIPTNTGDLDASASGTDQEHPSLSS